MPKASELKKGFVIESNGKTLLIKEIEITTPGGRGGAKIYKLRCTDLATGLKIEERFKSDELVPTVEMTKRPVTFSYFEDQSVIFMDSENYDQYSFNKEDIADELLFITEDAVGLYVILVNEKVATLELPSTVDLVITETSPSIKGASASARTKPATVSSGLTVQVPEYISDGEKIRINTAERKYMSRAD